MKPGEGHLLAVRVAKKSSSAISETIRTTRECSRTRRTLLRYMGRKLDRTVSCTGRSASYGRNGAGATRRQVLALTRGAAG